MGGLRRACLRLPNGSGATAEDALGGGPHRVQVSRLPLYLRSLKKVTRSPTRIMSFLSLLWSATVFLCSRRHELQV